MQRKERSWQEGQPQKRISEESRSVTDSESPSELFIPTKSENRLAHGIRVPCSGIREPTVQVRPIEE
jgi:hypothetical protein